MDKELRRIKQAKNELQKLLLFGSWLTKEMKKKGAKPPIIVGGSALEIYTFGHYTSGDIDLVAPREWVKEILLSSGYFREEGRYFISEKLGLFVEVPDEHLAGDINRVRSIKVPETGEEVFLIGLEDLIIDRLLACVFWKSEEDCLMAEVIIRKYRKEIDLKYLVEKAKEEGVYERLESIINKDEGESPQP